jgi:hypothetical protein
MNYINRFNEGSKNINKFNPGDVVVRFKHWTPTGDIFTKINEVKPWIVKYKIGPYYKVENLFNPSHTVDLHENDIFSLKKNLR